MVFSLCLLGNFFPLKFKLIEFESRLSFDDATEGTSESPSGQSFDLFDECLLTHTHVLQGGPQWTNDPSRSRRQCCSNFRNPLLSLLRHDWTAVEMIWFNVASSGWLTFQRDSGNTQCFFGNVVFNTHATVSKVVYIYLSMELGELIYIYIMFWI